MMRRSAGFDADKARRQLLKEWYNVPALKLTANDYITCRVNSVDLKNRFRDIETDCRDRLHVWLLRIVGASTAPTSMALPCRWRSRPQHQKRTSASQQKTAPLRGARWATGKDCEGSDAKIALALLRHRRDQPLEKAVDGVVVDPAHDRDKIVLGIDIDHIEPVAIVHKGGARRTWPLFAISVEEIVDESVGRLQSGRGEGHAHPPLRQQLPVAPLAPPQCEIAEARHVIGVDEHAASPMASTGHRLDRLAVDHNPGIVVAEPAPGVGRADGIHNLLFEHLRQRPPPEVQRSESQHVHPGIVVFVDGASLIARSREPLVRFVGRPVPPSQACPKALPPSRW